MSDLIDIAFAARGGALPVDHGYLLFAAVSSHLPALHDWCHDDEIAGEPGIFAISGEPSGNRLVLTPRSRLRLRLPPVLLASAMALTGTTLEVGDAAIVLGVPMVRPLVPAAIVRSRLVVIKVAHQEEVTPESFLAAADRQLATLNIHGEAMLPVHPSGERVGQPRRKVLRVKGAVRVGYSMAVADLPADDSLRLQSHGLGGRRRMGCGLFLPERGQGR